ncbi:hypothetical protein [Deinococcus rubellus]|uniref:hypothetical protein n=1 Tax=Deinococcus rubellus TaxID=1889240 RepID=UPI0031ED539B
MTTADQRWIQIRKTSDDPHRKFVPTHLTPLNTDQFFLVSELQPLTVQAEPVIFSNGPLSTVAHPMPRNLLGRWAR